MSYLGRSAKLSLKAQEKVSFLATAGQTNKTGLSYVPNFVEVYVNGILLTDTTDFTATNGNSVTFTVALALNDEVTVVSLKTFTVADHYTKSQANALLAAKETVTNVALKAPLASPTFTGLTRASGALVAESLAGRGGGINVQRIGLDNSKLRIYVGDGTDGTTTNEVYYEGNNQPQNFTFSNVTVAQIKAAGLDVTGNVTVNSGNLVIGTSGKGIDFSANGNAGGMTSEVLDDYEEGTWTPVVTFGGASAGLTYNIQLGRYTKVGNLVTAMAYISLSSKGTSTGPVKMSGLPFNTENVNTYPAAAIGYTVEITFADMMLLHCTPNSNTMALYETTNAGAASQIANTDFTNNSGIIYNVSYRVA